MVQILLAGILVLTGVLAFAQESKSFKINRERSEITFLSGAFFENDKDVGYTVKGIFPEYEAKIESENAASFTEKFLNTSFNFKVKMASLKTSSAGIQTSNASVKASMLSALMTQIAKLNNERDKHLLSDDFIDAKNYPEASFKSLKIEARSATEFTMKGKLTLRGIAKNVNINLEVKGPEKDQDGKIHYYVTGTSNELLRKDFGMAKIEKKEIGPIGIVIKNDFYMVVKLDLYEEQ